MTTWMFQAARALSHLMAGANIDSDKVTVIICADDPITRSRLELAVAREINDVRLFADPVISQSPYRNGFKLHGVRVVVSDLTDERPQYLIAQDAPQ